MSQMWMKGRTRWQFKCLIDWEPLRRARERFPDNERLREWVEALNEQYGDDWPALGCHSKFKPWAKGASMVLELHMGDGRWQAISADRLPAILDDEIKEKQREFLAATKLLKPDDLLEILPMSFPETYVLDRTLFPGVARYPVDEWKREGRSCITSKGWAKLCLRIANNDMAHLENVFKAATTLESRL